MDVEQTKQYCRAFQGVLEQNTGHPSNVLVFRVDKKNSPILRQVHRNNGDLAYVLILICI